MPKTLRKTDYLFHKNGSPNWYIRLQFQGRDQIQSLGTSDKLEAEAKAAALIGEHKKRLFEGRPRLVARPHKLTPGEYTVDGERVIATEREIIYLKPDGALIRTEPNSPTRELINVPMGAIVSMGGPVDRTLGPVIDFTKLVRPAITKGGDDAIIETYLDHGGRKKTGIHGYYRREALDVWALFKRLTENKPLKECTRDDGRKLVRHFQEQGLRSATIGKKIAWLNSAVHFAINEARFQGLNPFAGIAPDGDANGNDDTEDRLPLDDADMKAIKRELGTLSTSDQLLIRMLGSTGMRLSEAFEIDGEETERGIRFCIVGRKTEASKRRVPFPAAVLPYLPKKITGPLFTSDHKDPVDAASKRLNRFLDDIGVNDPRKVIHSFRHRAKDRLRAFECPDKMQQWLLGHDEKTVADSYGKGPPVKVLKKWIEKIRF